MPRSKRSSRVKREVYMIMYSGEGIGERIRRCRVFDSGTFTCNNIQSSIVYLNECFVRLNERP